MTVFIVLLIGAVQVAVPELRVKSVGQVEHALIEEPEQVAQVVSHFAQYEPVP
jgi:hypothetical protein